MKKITVFSMGFWGILLCMSNVFADDGSGFAMIHAQQSQLRAEAKAAEITMCGESHVSFDGTQAAGDDEFLYDTLTAYESVANRRDGGTVNGTVFECDNKHCPDGNVRDMGPGHVFKGQVISQATQYRCSTSLIPGDRWIAQSVGCLYRNTFLKVGQQYSGTLTRSDCLQFDVNADAQGTEFYARCENVGGTTKMQCYVSKCSGNMKVQNNKCVDTRTTPNPNIAICENSGGTWNGTACGCDTARGLTSASTTACKCVQSNATYNSTQKKCVENRKDPQPPVNPVTPDDPVVPVAPYVCDANEMAFVRSTLITWAAHETVTNMAREIIAYCNGENRTESEFVNKMTQLRALIAVLEQSQLNARLSALKEKITQNIETLKTYEPAFKADARKWRNEDGKFNTARLASDSIAGVVLGTTGALVTSKVVKKNQVKNGFDDIQCTIGGQVVAGWDDQFTIGVNQQ